MQTALLQLLEGVGLMGGTPKNISSPWQRWQESFARQDFKAEVNQNRVLTGIKAATRALEMAVSYAAGRAAESPFREASPALCEKLSEAQNHPGKRGQICLGLWACTLSSHTRDVPAVCICKTTAHLERDFKLQHSQALIPSESNPWTVQSMFNHSNLLYTSCQVSHAIACSLLCPCLDSTFQHSTWDILIHFLLKTDQLFPVICLTHSMCFPKQNNVFAAHYALINHGLYMIHPKHWWQIYFTLPSKEKKVMQSGFKIQFLLYQTKYFTANLQIPRVDLTSLPW